ncbi:hypothetical protein [Micromonospora sp. WMMD710]|uniref:hypothetical protein n=1 Tax=Micromonospora sp. WMMD710 TaxID=3016085 RepID=UPI0024178F76|nr:hypothetical protein [Micromonospora sp. WMMD710]MDG4757285.1 hypothetical protein [Micromonospora sp. WMMD710]
MLRLLRSAPVGDDEERPYWSQRSWQLSAGFVAVVLVVGLFALLVKPDDAQETSSTQSVRIDAGPGQRPDGCQTDDSAQGVPVRAPNDVTWRELNGGSIPVSRSAGPRVLGGPLLWCFAHTPMGAVLAANVIPRQLSGRDWAQVAERQIIPGEDREIFVSMRATYVEPAGTQSVASLAGFSLVSYSDSVATVRILMSFTQGMAVTEYTVAWSGGDWKIKPLPSGDLHTALIPMSTSSGFIMWKV